jgi:deazaflavin-dependent oxidoreductase (nitroreductase family)
VKGSELAVRFGFSPSGAWIDRWCVRILGHSPVVWLFARSDGVAYNHPLVLTTTGRRTGRPRPVVLPFFDAGGGRIAIVGSRGGMKTDPYWARNLREAPEAKVHLRRRPHDVRARLVEGDARAPLWEQLVERAPVYGHYQERCRATREIPVFVLERADGAALG